MKINFNTLPNEPTSNNIKPGFHNVRIEDVTTQVNSTGSLAVVVTYKLENLKIMNYVTYQSAAGDPINMGLYTIKRMLETCNVIPKGDFDVKLLKSLLLNKEHRAEIVEEEYQDKTYLKIGHPRTFSAIERTPQEIEAEAEQEELMTELNNAQLVEDDEIF